LFKEKQAKARKQTKFLITVITILANRYTVGKVRLEIEDIEKLLYLQFKCYLQKKYSFENTLVLTL